MACSQRVRGGGSGHNRRRARLPLALAALAALAATAAAQFGGGGGGMGGMPGMGGGMPEPPKAAAVKEDLPYVRCQACEALVKAAARKVKAMREELKPGKKLEESAIMDYLERACDTARPEGKWLTHYDIVEDGQRLKLVDTGKPSRCNTECATLARACAEISDAADLSDLSEALFLGKSRSALTQLVCYESSRACSAKPPPVPATRKPGPKHEPMSDEEAQREQLMASMKAAGLGGQMFSRDDIAAQLGGGGGFGGDDDDDAGGGGGAGGGGIADTVAESVAKASEVVSDAVGQAKQAAAAAVDKASSLLSSVLGGGGDGSKKDDGEL